jgi:hypothetical protein
MSQEYPDELFAYWTDYNIAQELLEDKRTHLNKVFELEEPSDVAL